MGMGWIKLGIPTNKLGWLYDHIGSLRLDFSAVLPLPLLSLITLPRARFR